MEQVSAWRKARVVMQVRACGNRSWSSKRLVFPAERLQASRTRRLTTITTSEKATQKSTTRPHLSVHHTSFLWPLCHESARSATHRFVAATGAGLPFSEISASSPHSCSRSRVAFEP